MANFQDYLDFMKAHSPALALLVTWAGIGILAIRRRLAWRKKQFLTHVNFSLNYCVGNQLAMRTLLEKPAIEVWPNEYGVRKIFAATAKTTIEHPFILLDDPKDQDFVNRAVLNVLSERFADTFLAASIGVPVKTGTFCYAVTYEKYEILRTLKVRVLIMEEKALEDLFGPNAGAQKLEVRNPVYQARLQSLKALYELMVKDRMAERPVLGKVELGVLLSGVIEPGSVEMLAACATSGTVRA